MGSNKIVLVVFCFCFYSYIDEIIFKKAILIIKFIYVDSCLNLI